jgi:hypothetical protein
MRALTLLLLRCGFSLLFGAAGAYLLRLARAAVARRRALRRRGVVTEGRVVKFETRRLRSRAGSPTYEVPVIELVTQAGQPVRFTPSRLLRRSEYPVGRRLSVRYLADDPSSADAEPVPSAWGPGVAVLALALVAFGIAALPWLLGPPAARP